MHSGVRRRGSILAVLALLAVVGLTPQAANAAPSIQITSAPPSTTTSRTATISFKAVGFTPTAITCSLDGGSVRSCRSPVSYTGLSIRDHSVRIVARNSRSSASTTVRWKVVSISAPTVAITSKPAAETTDTTATIAWSATNADRVELSLDGGPYTTSASPTTFGNLAVGQHSVVVRATNGGGSASATASWRIVAPPPVVTVNPTPPASPSPPSSYALPAGAVRVTSAAELQAALDAPAAQDIVLADGVYQTSGWFTNAGGHRLYAERLGGAVLASGLVIGGNWSGGAALVRGLVFDVTDSSRTLQGGLIHVWGPGGANVQVSDCVFRGNSVIAVGLLVYNPAGLVAERLTFTGFTDGGLRASDNQVVSYGAATPRIKRIADIVVDGVSRPTPGASNGTAEAGIWVGHPVTEGVRRIRIRNVSWSGLETVNNAWNTVYSDLDIDMSGSVSAAGIAIYLEHFNHGNTFERFRLTGAATGVNAEWGDPAWGGVAGAHNTVIRNGVIDAQGSTASKTFGVYLDEGTESTTVTGVAFHNQSFAAIGAYKNIGQNAFQGNDTTGILAGAVALSTQHWSSPTP
jgi:hypothetical protein